MARLMGRRNLRNRRLVNKDQRIRDIYASIAGMNLNLSLFLEVNSMQMNYVFG
jgi:hypothetical protein